MSDASAHVTGPEAARAANPIRVLLVDDQLLIGEAVRRMLAPEKDVQYRSLNDPTQALAIAKEFEPTVILIDLVMPQMDGLELVSQFRSDPDTTRIPLIVLSSMEEAATKAQAFKHGANDYLVKLPDRLELLARVRYHSAGYVSMLQRDAAYDALRRSQQLLADDLDQAARYVQSLLPEPVDEGLSTSWRFIPSASLGGDAFGYHWLDENTFVVYLLDVAGHGVGAALLSVSVLNILRSGSLRKTDFSDPGQVLSRLNDAFRMQDHGGKFFTIWYGVYKPSTRTLRWAGGGHPPAQLFVPGEPAQELASCGPMPGVLPDLVYETRTAQVPPGARLLVFSDGLYELRLHDESVLTFPDLMHDLEVAVKGGEDPLQFALDRAHRHCGEIGYADDVSAVQVTIP
jgi:sigma-B regulation protein RsbU (phosphoserine phosphatase)